MVHDSMSLCCVLCFDILSLFVSLQCTPLGSFLYVLLSVFSPSSLHVCLPLSVSTVSSMLSPLCLPLIISPVLFPPLSPPVPRSLIIVSVYLSLGSPCTLCQFVVVCVMSPSSSLCVSSWFWYSFGISVFFFL